ncbi:MAG: tetratricopeptide repeat protein [Acidobacteriota bacterium]
MAFKRENVIRSAEKYVSRGKLEAAIREYRKVLAENPNDANTLNRVGDLYARIERFDEAVKLFTQIAEQYTRDGFFVKAIAIYKKIIKLDPTSLPVYERLAELYHRQGLINEARSQYQVLADYYEKHDNATSALNIYHRMAELEPDDPKYLYKLAELYTSQRLDDKAIQSYRKLADLFVVDGSLDEATKVYLTALDVSAENLEMIKEGVAALHNGGATSNAAQVLAKAVQLNPEAAKIAKQVGLTQDALPDDTSIEETSATISASPADEPEIEIEIEDEPSFDLAGEGGFDLGGGDLDNAMAAAAAAVDDQPASLSADDDGTFTLDLDDEEEAAEIESFTLDLDDDDEPSSQVKPPPDLEPLPEVDKEEEVFTFDLEDDGPAPAFAGPPSLDEAADATAFSLDLDLEDDAPAPTQVAPPDDDEGTFTLDLDDDEDPPSQVKPPPDLEPSAWQQESSDDAFDLSFEDVGLDEESLDEVALDEEPLDEEPLEEDAFDISFAETPPRAASPVAADEELFGDATVAIDRPAAHGEDDVEIDWQMDDLDLPEPDALVDEPSIASSGAHAIAEIDLEIEDDDEPVASVPEEAEPEPVIDEAPVVAAPVEPDPAPADEPPPVRREEDLLAEAQVFFKYGLNGKAEDRLRELLDSHAEHLPALELFVRLRLAEDAHDDVLERANHLAELAIGAGETELWQRLRDTLADAGFTVDEERVVGLPGEFIETSQSQNRIMQLLESLDEVEPAPTPAPVVEVEETPPEPVTTSEPKKLVSLADELSLDDLDDELDSELDTIDDTPAAEPAASLVDALDDTTTGMSWLDDVSSPTPTTSPVEDSLFDEEDDFFDLAAELERELTDDELMADTEMVQQPQEQSLEDIVEGFKKGVAEHLSAEDYDTHFNLGIAYREMGLLDEAIGEFQLSSKDPRHLVESSSMLGICFLDKGLPELAIKWYRKGLEATQISDDEAVGLLYDMANVYIDIGNPDAAYKTFVELYGINSNYRDVSVKLQELAGQRS